MLRWYVVETKHNAELFAVDQLLRQGFDAFSPTYVSRRAIRMLFPHYAFVRFDIEARGLRWRSVNGTRGVKALLWGEDPAPLPAGVGESLYTMGPLIDPDKSVAELLIGRRVRITEGAWVDQIGTVLTGAGARVKVLLSFLGRQVGVDLHAKDVVPVY